MRTSKDGIEFIKAHEGFRATPYKDTAGRLTIGFGHLIKKGEVFGAISSVEATAMMQRDVGPVETAINHQVTILLLQNQFDALVSFIYNVGDPNFEPSTMHKKLNNGDITGAADEFLKWDHDHVNGILVEEHGLHIRRAQERAMFLGGVYA